MTEKWDEKETDALFQMYMHTAFNLELLTEILVKRGYTHSELAVHFKEHREIYQHN